MRLRRICSRCLGTADYARMKSLLWFAVTLGLLGCGGDGVVQPASISVVGSFRPFSAGVILRFVAPDCERHGAEIPFSRVSIPADSLLNIRENFFLEVADRHAANSIVRMDLSLF